MEDAVIVENLVKHYGRERILNEVSFRIRKGTIFGVLGPNGAGKTTLLRILATLLKYDGGRVVILGFEIPKDAGKVRERIGFVPENFVFYDRLTVYENIRTFFLLYDKNDETDVENFAESVLREFGIWNRRNVISGKLSRGMKQRLNVARCLVNDPDLILLDEPFLGLDPYSVRKLRNVLLKERERGKTIIVTSHLIDEMVRICDDILILKNGSVVDWGRMDEILRKYSKERFEDLFLALTGSDEE